MTGHREEGAITVPLLLLFLAFVIAVAGCLLLSRDWRHLIEEQNRLDLCTRTEGQLLLKRIRRVESSILRYRVLRAAAAVPLAPAAMAAARAAVRAEYAFQEMQRALWLGSFLSWRARGGCGDPFALSRGYPDFPWEREPPDPIGPGELRWKDGVDADFILSLHTRSRASAARIRKGTVDEDESDWSADWVIPPRLASPLSAVLGAPF